MDLNLSLRPRLALQQRMTPQLICLMQLLAHPCYELRSEVLKALDDNPALEEDQDDDDGIGAEMPEAASVPSCSQATITSDTELAGFDGGQGSHAPQSDELRLLEHLDGAGSQRGGLELEADDDDHSFRDPAAARSTGLAEHLLAQLREEFGDEKLLSIGEWIIGNLDASGYLREEVSVIAKQLAVEPEDVARVLGRVQMFDPIGAAARDARECLLIQARAHFPDRPHLISLIEHHLPAIKERRYSAIARTLGVTVEEVVDEEKRLVALNPRPARGFGDETPTYIMSDVHILKVGGDFIVRVNDAGLPKLRVSPYCRQILRNTQAASPEEVAFVRARVTAAKWFIKSIYMRQETILRVTEAIVRRQHDFFDRGREYLRPMILKDVAADIGMAESTVSRVTSRKYADTPQGVLELKYFFGTGFHTASGAEVASESVKEVLRRMLVLENPCRPLSDQQIVSRLRNEHSVMIARRTVAKYREVLGIGSSNERRRRKDWGRARQD